MSNSSARGRWLRLVLPLLLVAIAAGACAGATASPAASAAAAPEDGERMGSSAGQEAPSMAPATAAPAAGGVGLPPENGAPPADALVDNRKIVYTGSLELVVGDVGASLAKAKAAVLAGGGYVGGSEEHNDGDRSVATISYRIPAERWDATLDTLRGLATKVVGEQTQATEVGDQLVDLAARLRNLRASEEVLVGIAKSTGKVGDLLEVEARISEVRGVIEQLDAQRLRLEDQVAYGTLVTTFGTEVAQVQETAKGWDPASDVDAAMATLIGAGQGIVSGAIWFGIVWLPVILVLLLVALVGRWLWRRFAPRTAPSGPVAGWGGGQ